jgi:hypothetical protein
MPQANLDDKESLVRAMTGADVVYGMTNYWDTMDMQKEIQQGKDLADAARQVGVGHYIWSTLKHVGKRKSFPRGEGTEDRKAASDLT